MSHQIKTLAELEATLEDIRFKPSCVNFDWTWEVKPVCEILPPNVSNHPRAPTHGWLIRTGFVRPDVETGEWDRGFGRWEFVAVGSSVSAVVKTCWVLAEMIVKHELMEAFTYRDVTIFNPHHTVEDLSLPQRRREEIARSSRSQDSKEKDRE